MTRLFPDRMRLRLRRRPGGTGQPSTALVLALFCAGLIVYASLYPFSDWFWPAGQPLSALLVPAWPRWSDRFDIWANLLGYMPLGALIYGGLQRSGRQPVVAATLAAVLPSTLSWAMEFTQHFLPGRYPSLLDWTLNSLGALAGLAGALALQAAGAIERWQVARERWFEPGSGRLLALLLLWPPAFLFPSPIPFGLGPSWERMQEFAYEALADHPQRAWFDWLWAGLGSASAAMSPAAEAFGVAVGLLGPCLVAFTITRRGWRRAGIVGAALVCGVGANALSAALNFGPSHAMAWVTPVVPVALLVGALTTLTCTRLRARACAALGLVALTVGIALVAQAPSDPYYAESLAAWEQGRFVRFHGIAQWLGWSWPLLAAAALFVRLSERDRPSVP